MEKPVPPLWLLFNRVNALTHTYPFSLSPFTHHEKGRILRVMVSLVDDCKKHKIKTPDSMFLESVVDEASVVLKKIPNYFTDRFPDEDHRDSYEEIRQILLSAHQDSLHVRL